MALVSPGVEVTIVDQSQYLPAAPASIPLIVLATAQNKANAAGTGIAVGTTAANANKLYRVTSQRDLVTLFGNPFFYKTTNGTPIQGYELNEYGLLAAYSVLGSTNLVYVIRSDIDLSSLIGKTGRPSAAPPEGTVWLDTGTSSWGIFQFNQSTGVFSTITPIVITDADFVGDYSTPNQDIGNIGDYAVTMIENFGAPNSYHTYWYKNNSNEWISVGSPGWMSSWPTIQGTQSAPSTLSGNLVINGITVAVPSSPNNNLTGLVTAINAAAIPFVTAAAVNGRLTIYSNRVATVDTTSSTPSLCTDLGITIGVSYAPAVSYGTNAQQPLWRNTDAQPHPTGSVWIKTNSLNRGANSVVSQYSAATDTFVAKTVQWSTSDWAITDTLDSAGGLNIPATTIYAQYNFDTLTKTSPVQYFRRSAVGAAVFVGIVTDPEFTASASFEVQVSVPGSASLSDAYTVTLPSAPRSGQTTINAVDFVTSWTAADIPNTTAEVSTTGAIVLTHTAGGVIILNDNLLTSTALTEAGFVINDPNSVTPGTTGAKWGPYKTISFTDLDTTGGAGSSLTVDLSTYGPTPTITVNTAGTGYAVGNRVTIDGGNPAGNDFIARITSVGGSGQVTGLVWDSGYATSEYSVQLSNWQIFNYTSNASAPVSTPANNTNWFYSVINQIDIMSNVGGEWQGYRNVAYGADGLPRASGSPSTDPNGPIIAAVEPITQSDGTPLAYGDLWIDSNDLENYPVISRWQNFNGIDQWVLIDNTDQTTETGIVFADARWAPNGNVDPVNDPIPTITSLLTSDYLDLDAPLGQSYPQGTLLFNTRRSGYNVKQFRVNYFSRTNFPDQQSYPNETNAWVSVSGNMTNGAPYMGRKAQRSMVVQALKTTVDTSSQIREEDTFFNLMATPNYCELQPNMVTLNNDRGQTAYIIGDTPLRLAADANSITAWATNAVGASSTSEEGLVTRNTYLGIYYPSGITSDLTGSQVVVPPSHMMLRTIIYNDTVAYPWFAPAGQRRGVVDNADNIGYIDGATGEFVSDKNRVQLRDVEYSNFINPIAFFTNIGLLNYGNKNSFDSSSALDRTNVARLVAYLRWNLQQAVRPFLFEPNDSITRTQARAVVQTLLADIMSKRGVYDYLVVCDESNNTPARIDRNELWIDVAIEPVKAIEFIYIPVRILNTGEISGLALNG